MAETIEFRREALYQEVWAEPLTKVAARYGLSDNGLRKVCRALTVPVPERGYWAKVAAGQPTKRPPLGECTERETFVSRPPEPSVDELADEADRQWLAERIALEDAAENRIAMDMAPRRWHAAVRDLRDEFRAEARELPKILKEAERAKKNPQVARFSGYNGWKAHAYEHSGGLLQETHHSMPLRVSVGTYERALAIVNTLCFEAEKRGFVVTLNDKDGRFEFSGHGGTVQLRISEKTDEAWREEIRYGNKPEKVKYRTATGVLRLYAGARFHEREIADADQPLENKLNEVFEKVYQGVVRERREEREHQARERRWAEEARLRKEAEARRKEEEARAAEDRRKRRELIRQARRWETAELLRRYLAALESGTVTDEWRRWAAAVADELDPTVAKPSDS
jgi:hypothetical protein